VQQHISDMAGKCPKLFVGNLVVYPAVKAFEKSVTIWRNYR